MRKPKTPKPRGVRVIRDPRDYRRDYFIPAATAKTLLEQGKLWFDLTNNCYSEPKKAAAERSLR